MDLQLLETAAERLETPTSLIHAIKAVKDESHPEATHLVTLTTGSQIFCNLATDPVAEDTPTAAEEPEKQPAPAEPKAKEPTKAELLKEAKALGLSGVSKLNRTELAKAVAKARSNA